MSYFWASVLPVFLPVVLLLAGHWAVRPTYGVWFYVLSSIAALIAGVLASFVLPKTQVFSLNFSLLQAVLIIAFLLWQFTSRREPFWQFILIAVAAVQWGNSPALMALTTTHIINTELLLNIASVIVILALCMLLGWLLYLSLKLLPRTRWPLLLATGVLLLGPISGNVLLSLMKLQVLDLTKPRLSYAAKTTKLESEITYTILAIVLALTLIAVVILVRKRRSVWKQAEGLISRRMAQAAYRRVRALQAGVVAIALVMFAGQAYWDAIASQPPSLSKATRVQLSADGEVRLTLQPLMDGNLHRFAWIADDGRVVRFFVINRLPDRIAPAAVFDACLLCGDKGYVQQGDQVVCIACGVYMFKPSIGKPGGCNPVPIDGWKVIGEELVISRPSLERGLSLFRTVMTISVTDPVSGRKLTNTDAPHRYTYAGKTYFFADEHSLEAFRTEPEKYMAGAGQ